MNGTHEDKIKRLKELIAIKLDHCDKLDWPYICHMNSTEHGRKELEEMIIQQCAASGCAVGEALDRIERAFNPNRMED